MEPLESGRRIEVAHAYHFPKIVFWLAIFVGVATLLDTISPLGHGDTPAWRPFLVALVIAHVFVAFATILLIVRTLRRRRPFRGWNAAAILAGVAVTVPLVWAWLKMLSDPFG